MSEFYKVNKGLIDKLIFSTIFIIIIYLLYTYVLTYIYPFIFGYIISIIISPMVNSLVKKFNLNRGIATVLSIIFLLFIIGGLGVAVISRVIQEGSDFINNLPEMVYYVENTINEFNLVFKDLHEIIPEGLQKAFYSLTNMIIDLITSILGYGIKNLSTSFISKVPRVAIGIVLAIISGYFFSKDKKIVNRFIKSLMPNNIQNKVIVIKKAIGDALGGYFRAQLTLMTIVATICTIGLLFIGTPYALFLGLFIAIMDSLPVLGSGFFYWPWIAFSLITNDYSQAIGLSIIYLTILLTRQALEPNILGKELGIHPLITLMSIYIGLRFFGFLGIVLGPCITVIFKSLLETNLGEKNNNR